MGRDLEEPVMSDKTVLISVEDLINVAMGPAGKNVVNFKLVQTILHILARQMRMLGQRVELKITEDLGSLDDISEDKGSPGRRRPSKEKDQKKRDKSAFKSREKEEKGAGKAEKGDKDEKGGKEEKGQKFADKGGKEKSKDDKGRQKSPEISEKEKVKEAKTAEREKGKETKGAEKGDKEKAKETKGQPLSSPKGEKEKAKESKSANEKGEKGKEEKGSQKSGEKGEKEKPKDQKGTEKDKADKEAQKEKGKGESKDKKKDDKMTEKEREKAESEKQKGGKGKEEASKGGMKGKSKTDSDTSVVITEVDRQKEKVLVVEKGPTTRTESRREGIEVVTRSQFEIVEGIVRELQGRAGPLPSPALPDNEKLRSDLAKGSASLIDTMQAMQVTARVRAAEQAISRMGDLLTQLAASGALPAELAGQIEQGQFSLQEDGDVATGKPRGTTVSYKSVGIQESPDQKAPEVSRGTDFSRKASIMSRPSVASAPVEQPKVTRPEMEAALRTLRDDLMKNAQNLTTKATGVAEAASVTARGVSEKLTVAILLDGRISALNTLVTDYADQLSGFDTGLTIQMQSFRDQMSQIEQELKAGLTQLEQVNNNAETTAVKELNERYEGLVSELDQTLNAHHRLTGFQRQLEDELHSLVECVEMLREQKADRDEVLDGLRDKADNSRLAGLLTVLEFQGARKELENRLDVCHEKFRKQEAVWMVAMKDMLSIAMEKAELTQMLSLRDQALTMLKELQDMQVKLAAILGEPKAAMVMRELSRGASCGVCLVPALMDPRGEAGGAPPALPAALPSAPPAARARPAPAPAPAHHEEPCEATWHPPPPPDDREHICLRWCGGSHTLVSEATPRTAAPPPPRAAPTRRYTGYGSDGRLYMMEDELQPCVECNQFLQMGGGDVLPDDGVGETDNTKPTEDKPK